MADPLLLFDIDVEVANHHCSVQEVMSTDPA
jgi:hypothetical protein